jgi:SAM-dependent methyltransferase
MQWQRTGGYSDPEAYLALNASRNAADPERKFSLKFALERWDSRLSPGLLLRHLGASPRCLIQGSASADNVGSLSEFLRRHGIMAPDIHVIDLIDLSAVWNFHASAKFCRADAGDLAAVFAAGSFDLVVQDHLLNVAPFSTHPNILSEMRRILRPDGIALLQYTDPAAFPPAEGQAFLDQIEMSGRSVQIGFTKEEYSAIAHLPAEHRLVAVGSRFFFITLPLGILEFFMPMEELRILLEQAGLCLRESHLVPVTDSEGLPCRRHHCLITRPGQ